MHGKKKVKYNYLTADERPLFGPHNAVQKTAKDKQRERRNQKLQLRDMMYSYHEE